MPTAIDKIVEGFPQTTIQPIDGLPNYETLAALHSLLNSNAASVHSNLGNGKLSLLHLTISDAVYNTLSTTTFVAPVNPGAVATIPARSTAAEIADLHRRHAMAVTLFTEYHNTDKALTHQLVGAIDPMFTRSLRSKYVGYQKHTTKQILDYLYSTYAKISATDLLANDAKMKQDVDVNQPIEVFFDQIEDAVDFADAAKCPYTPEQVTTTAFQLFNKTGMYQDDCKLWKRKAATDKTWENFKKAFTEAHQELRETTNRWNGGIPHSQRGLDIAS